MKFTVKSSGKMNLDFGAKTVSTNGNGVFGTFRFRNSKDSKKESLDDDAIKGSIDVDILSSMEVELGVDEFEELSKFCKENFETKKDYTKFLYNGAKKFLDDIIIGIKTRGKTIVDVIGEINEEYLIRKAKTRDLEKVLQKEKWEEEVNKKDE